MELYVLNVSRYACTVHVNDNNPDNLPSNDNFLSESNFLLSIGFLSHIESALFSILSLIKNFLKSALLYCTL